MIPTHVEFNKDCIFDYHILYDESGDIYYFDKLQPANESGYMHLTIPNNEFYSKFIETEPLYWDLIDFCIINGELAWAHQGEDRDLVILQAIRSSALRHLSYIAQQKIEAIQKNEQKAKTLILEWLEAGSIGEKPLYWVEWKNERDSINSQYNEYKNYILDEDRTVADLEYLKWTANGLEIVKPATQLTETVTDESEIEEEQVEIPQTDPEEDITPIEDTSEEPKEGNKIEFVPPP